MPVDTSSPTDLTAESAGRGATRRTVIKTAAWSLPVIAAVVATPLAAASGSPGDRARVDAVVGGTIAANPTEGTATGTFLTSGVRIYGVEGTFSTGELTASYTLTGPWNTGSITKPDGSAFVQGETITHGGTVWTVTSVSVSSFGVRRVAFSGTAVTISAPITISIPPAEYAGTFTPGVPDEFNRVGGTVSVAAADVAGGVQASSASTFP